MTQIKTLIKGYQDFYQKYFTSGSMLYPKLVELGQSPKTLIIACSDSRVDPSIITNSKPGDIFVIRNVANLVPPYQKDEMGYHGVSAALEFAVKILNVENIVILGHSHCAGIQTLLNPTQLQQTDFIGRWVEIAQSAKQETLKKVNANSTEEDHQHICEHEGILLSLDNLLTFPWIKEKVAQNTLKLHGWYFSILTGTLEEYNPSKKCFAPIAINK